MKLLFTEEVKNKDELEKKLYKMGDDLNNYRIGVISILQDKQGRYLLQ